MGEQQGWRLSRLLTLSPATAAAALHLLLLEVRLGAEEHKTREGLVSFNWTALGALGSLQNKSEFSECVLPGLDPGGWGWQGASIRAAVGGEGGSQAASVLCCSGVAHCTGCSCSLQTFFHAALRPFWRKPCFPTAGGGGAYGFRGVQEGQSPQVPR